MCCTCVKDNIGTQSGANKVSDPFCVSVIAQHSAIFILNLHHQDWTAIFVQQRLQHCKKHVEITLKVVEIPQKRKEPLGNIEEKRILKGLI
jgi:fructosamine-3-kinase